MKKAIAIEFFWFIVALIVALPVGLLTLNLLGETSFSAIKIESEQKMAIVLYLICVAVAFVGVYFTRFVALAISIMVAKEEEEPE